MPFVFIMALCFAACGSSENAQRLARQTAEARFNGEVEYVHNSDSSYVICSTRPKVRPGHPLRPLHFLVFDLNRKTVAYEDSLESADIYWLTNTRIQVHFIPEVISADEEASGYMYDLLTHTKYPFLQQH